ncbi:3-hydroxyisobutyrate dehydrogenase [Alcanivorax sp. JB21]|uniref:3-hydroxyisobutyrate dehydrogenase n=1 Tax=Alcanivorax limicola TaxID=2874102 RepID=UPI001CC0531A|nr:3-hydroxyisobutyrate dehydrogenase [Alcanivorax limicola]MBZ2189820.1 3-hydroxyisobutyrate dehydrogenase [Alcanivorax limicola]
MNIAFFGVGNMGGPMAANLVNAGHTVRVYDLAPALVEEAVAAGAEAGNSPADTVAGAEVVISMLPSANAVKGLYLGAQNLLGSIPAEALVIDCSTIDAATSRLLATAAAEQGRTVIDAPVSGGVGGAKAATLTFICGGDEAAVERARPILLAMGKKVFRAGDHGAGQTAKLCNNMLLAVHMIGTCEALQLGADNGLDPAVLSEIMQASSGRNWSLEVYNPWPGVMPGVPSSNDYQGGFAVDLMNKDLTLAMGNAMQSGTRTPMGALARSLYGLHGGQGSGQLDFASILRFIAGQPAKD